MDNPPEQTVLADRRWLIGICISVVFGIFGAVMALLGYADRDKSPALRAGPAGTSAPAVAPAPRGHGRGRGHQ